jgi:isopentenyl-diphosphate delta-isomerase
MKPMPTEYVVLVDAQGRPIGRAEKLPTHHADTPLHLAFSLYVFDERGKFLATRRAAVKKVWPTVWTNSICGHPAPDEPMEAAMRRRAAYELGMEIKDITNLVPDYIYKTPPYQGVIEHEYCPIYVARAASNPQPNPQEVDDYRWLEWPEYVELAEADTTNQYSWWCKDQLRLLKDHPGLRAYCKKYGA